MCWRESPSFDQVVEPCKWIAARNGSFLALGGDASSSTNCAKAMTRKQACKRPRPRVFASIGKNPPMCSLVEVPSRFNYEFLTILGVRPIRNTNFFSARATFEKEVVKKVELEVSTRKDVCTRPRVPH